MSVYAPQMKRLKSLSQEGLWDLPAGQRGNCNYERPSMGSSVHGEVLAVAIAVSALTAL